MLLYNYNIFYLSSNFDYVLCVHDYALCCNSLAQKYIYVCTKDLFRYYIACIVIRAQTIIQIFELIFVSPLFNYRKLWLLSAHGY